jgi:hypothetical protein
VFNQAEAAGCKTVTILLLCKQRQAVYELRNIEERSSNHYHHHHKHQGLDPLIRSVSRVTAVLANVVTIIAVENK